MVKKDSRKELSENIRKTTNVIYLGLAFALIGLVLTWLELFITAFIFGLFMVITLIIATIKTVKNIHNFIIWRRQQ